MTGLNNKLENKESYEMTTEFANTLMIYTLDGILENIKESKDGKAFFEEKDDKEFLDALCLICYARYDKELVYEFDEKNCYFKYKDKK